MVGKTRGNSHYSNFAEKYVSKKNLKINGEKENDILRNVDYQPLMIEVYNKFNLCINT